MVDSDIIVCVCLYLQSMSIQYMLWLFMLSLLCFSFRVPATSNKSEQDSWFQVMVDGNVLYSSLVILGL